MSDKLTKADVLAKAVRVYIGPRDLGGLYAMGAREIAMMNALAAYEAAPDEDTPTHCDDCDPSFLDCWNAKGPCRKKPLTKPAESQAAEEWIGPELKCRVALAAAQARIASLTGELDACEQHVKIKQERIAELLAREDRQTGSWNTLANCADTLRARDFGTEFGAIDDRVIAMAKALDASRERVSVLEKALEGAKDAITNIGEELARIASAGFENFENTLSQEDGHRFGAIANTANFARTLYESPALKAINAALAARSASGSQPSREKEGA